MRILLVEDDVAFRTTIAQLMRREGLWVIEAVDGHQAMALLNRNEKFDAVIADMWLPGTVDGVDVISHARRQNPLIAVLVMSGDLEWMSAELDHLNPPAIIIDKPFYMQDAIDALRRVVVAAQSDDSNTSLLE